MHDQQAISRVISRFYGAAYGAEDWTEALGDLTRLFNGSRGWLFHTRDDSVDGLTTIEDEGLETPEAQRALIADPVYLACRTAAPGPAMLLSEMTDLKSFRQGELWHDWMQPRDLNYGMQCILHGESGSQFLVDLYRGERQGNFEAADKNLLENIAPHLENARRIGVNLGKLRAMQALSDGLTKAAIVVDKSLRIKGMNTSAEAIISNFPGLDVRRGFLELAHPASARRLTALAAAAFSAAPTPGSDIVVVSRSSEIETERLVLSIMLVPAALGLGGDHERRAIIFLRVTGSYVETGLDDVLVKLFNLSPSQARLAAVLATGRSLRQAASDRGLTYSSARTYLDRIFECTNTSQQSELVALLRTIELSRCS